MASIPTGMKRLVRLSALSAWLPTRNFGIQHLSECPSARHSSVQWTDLSCSAKTVKHLLLDPAGVRKNNLEENVDDILKYEQQQ